MIGDSWIDQKRIKQCGNIWLGEIMKRRAGDGERKSKRNWARWDVDVYGVGRGR